ncbi:MAG: hypothetical protein ACRDQ0_05665 [Pseudonocardia sp.]
MTAYPLPTGEQIIGALTVKFGRQNRLGRWVETPAAKYECLLCDRIETAIGAENVTRFNQTIRTTHRANCPGHPTEGAQAA